MWSTSGENEKIHKAWWLIQSGRDKGAKAGKGDSRSDTYVTWGKIAPTQLQTDEPGRGNVLTIKFSISPGFYKSTPELLNGAMDCIMSTKSYVEALTPNVMVFGGGLLGGNWVRSRGWVPHAMISALKKEEERDLSRRTPRNSVLTRTCTCHHLDLRLPASRTVRSMCVRYATQSMVFC